MQDVPSLPKGKKHFVTHMVFVFCKGKNKKRRGVERKSHIIAEENWRKTIYIWSSFIWRFSETECFFILSINVWPWNGLHGIPSSHTWTYYISIHLLTHTHTHTPPHSASHTHTHTHICLAALMTWKFISSNSLVV